MGKEKNETTGARVLVGAGWVRSWSEWTAGKMMRDESGMEGFEDLRFEDWGICWSTTSGNSRICVFLLFLGVSRKGAEAQRGSGELAISPTGFGDGVGQFDRPLCRRWLRVKRILTIRTLLRAIVADGVAQIQGENPCICGILHSGAGAVYWSRRRLAWKRAFRRFEGTDGNIGLLRPEGPRKRGRDRSRAGKGTIDGTPHLLLVQPASRRPLFSRLSREHIARTTSGVRACP
jgi:hypothetical protein